MTVEEPKVTKDAGKCRCGCEKCSHCDGYKAKEMKDGGKKD